jgi:hypothetical protein
VVLIAFLKQNQDHNFHDPAKRLVQRRPRGPALYMKVCLVDLRVDHKQHAPEVLAIRSGKHHSLYRDGRPLRGHPAIR